MTFEYEDLEDVVENDDVPEWVGVRNKGREDGEEVARTHCPISRRRTTRMEGGRMTPYCGNSEGAR